MTRRGTAAVLTMIVLAASALDSGAAQSRRRTRRPATRRGQRAPSPPSLVLPVSASTGDVAVGEACRRGLEGVAKAAAAGGEVCVVEPLNSKVNHKDYMCDHTAWGAGLCEMVGSENFKLLYDIYHMSIMEGDVIATIKQYHKYIGHYHTGGVPGRNEIDEGQELYYPAILKAIVETGYKGFVAQEFIPKREPLASLAECVKICDVA